MNSVLKSKYNSTGVRCVDACLQYGELRYVSDDGIPTRIEVPSDKYDDAIAEFDKRISEGVSSNIRPTEVLRKGSVTYNQLKNFAEECKIRGLSYFPIDGSIDCNTILGVSGLIEYGLARWDGNDRKTSIKKSILRAISVNGEDFVRCLKIDNSSDETKCFSFAKSVQSTPGFGGLSLYQIQTFDLGGEIYKTLNEKKKSQKVNIKELNIDKIKEMMEPRDIAVVIISSIVSFALLQILTNFGALIGNIIIYILLSILVMILSSIFALKTYKTILNKHAASSSSNEEIMILFNDALEKNVYDYMLTPNEMKLILKNITQHGEIYKLLSDMKGSVNKISSVNIIMEKQTRFVLDARATITVPGTEEIRGVFTEMVSDYQGKLSKDYNVENVVDDVVSQNDSEEE